MHVSLPSQRFVQREVRDPRTCGKGVLEHLVNIHPPFYLEEAANTALFTPK